ncbi:expressed unknown protein [Seminavis robusta]|uniref:Uncharacterized protein n=1 Tax=Seminavis robusta TaxID=568900 RepID=A0A9N8HYA2_9STRA|nr:expressed unknown protein [Seminavis robusta]|eukprot:Sro3820_g351270.1 n/a (158) ;mRNA; f:2806-3279
MHGEYALEEAAESGSRSDLTSDEDQRLSNGSPEKQDDDDEYEILSTRDGGDYDGDIDDDVNDEPEPTSTNPSRQPEENLSPNVATSGAIARNSTAVLEATQRLLSQYNPENMQITAEERKQALTIKRTIECTPDLKKEERISPPSGATGLSRLVSRE